MTYTKDWVSLSDISLADAWEYMNKLKANLPEKKDNYFETLSSFKSYYQHHEQAIIEAAKKCVGRYYDAYPIQWETVLSPIELHLWYIIRCTGRVVLYPQYPVGPYFADFANPYLKIVVEVDGKEYHQDKERDNRRDAEMKANGWTVFRLTGAEVYKSIDLECCYEEEAEDMFWEWITQTGEGLIYALRAYYFERVDLFEHPRSEHIRRTLAQRSKHFTLDY